MLGVGVVSLLAYVLATGRWLYRRRRVLRAGEADDVVARYALTRRAEAELPPHELDPDRWVLAGTWFVTAAALLARGDEAVAAIFAAMPATYVLIDAVVLALRWRRRRSLLQAWTAT